MNFDWNEITLPGKTLKETIEYFYIKKGLSIEETAAKLGVDKSTLAKKMDQLKIKKRPPGWGDKRKKLVFSFISKEENRNKTAREIGTELNIPVFGARRYKMLFFREERRFTSE